FISRACVKGNRCKERYYLVVARQDFADTSNRGFGEPVIRQHPTLITAQGEQGFSRVRLQFLRILQSLLRCIAHVVAAASVAKVKKRLRTRKPRPGKRKLGVKLHRLRIKTNGFH